MALDRDSVLPLYYQLKEKIRRRIDKGGYSPGERIPSENEFAAKYNVSRNTAKQAIAGLVADGILYRRQGLGTFVSKKKVFHALTEKLSFSAEFSSEESTVVSKVISAEEIPAASVNGEALGMETDGWIFRIHRVRLIDGIPIALQTSLIPKTLCPTLLNYDFSERSLFDVLENEFGYDLHHANEVLDCVQAGEYEAHYLEIDENAPLFLLTRTTFNVRDEVVELVRSFMPGERCEFSFEHGKRGRIEIRDGNNSSNTKLPWPGDGWLP